MIIFQKYKNRTHHNVHPGGTRDTGAPPQNQPICPKVRASITPSTRHYLNHTLKTWKKHCCCSKENISQNQAMRSCTRMSHDIFHHSIHPTLSQSHGKHGKGPKENISQNDIFHPGLIFENFKSLGCRSEICIWNMIDPMFDYDKS